MSGSVIRGRYTMSGGVIRVCYAMSRMEIGLVSVHAALHGTDIAYGALASTAMSGTDVGDDV
eukprot:1401956-Rhodomonas_salina.1